MIRDMEPHRLYRHAAMMDVDFYCTRVTSDFVYGWWVLRRNGALLGRSPDRLIPDRIRPKDWTTVESVYEAQKAEAETKGEVPGA